MIAPTFPQPKKEFFDSPGFTIKTVRIPYAERKPATGRAVLLDFCQATSTSHKKTFDPHNAGPHVFYSPCDRQNVGQFGSRPCLGGTSRTPSPTFRIPKARIPYAERRLATGRAVLLEFCQATSTSHEFGSRPCLVIWCRRCGRRRRPDRGRCTCARSGARHRQPCRCPHRGGPR